MLNKIKNKLILTNTFVLLVILIMVTSFIYVFSSYSFSNTSDNELLNLVYQSKRFSKSNFKSIENDLSYNQELSYFKEKLSNEKCKLIFFNNELKPIFSSGKFKISKNKLGKIATLYFADVNSSHTEVKEQDGRYVFSDYEDSKISYRTCTTLITDNDGNMQLILIAEDNRAENATLNTLLYILALTVIFGVVASLLGGFYTADKALVPIKENMDNQRQFIADASHELRTPIAVIKTNLELIESNEDETVKSQEVWIDYAKSEIKRMDKMVGDLLILSKADLNEIPFNNKEHDIVHLIKEAIEKIEPIAVKREIRVYMACPYNRVKTNIDEDKFTQLLMILLDNAIKYSEDKTQIMITVKVNLSKNNVVIKVKDQGIGMKKDEIEKVFTRFYRIDKARSRRENGSGLGLPIAKWIVENLNGTINIESIEDKGTDVIIALPLISYEETE
ncbi:HAMP domain-containing sensor histidine kinase [uncultured Anaerofustis sp.]|uniref:sensor histidine kinase n=1 Tax=uncultured Anaerofustis sp. TaxID=904996 RepID=UPI0025D28867|nr:HAMP domain-containing sensor histidine kinase [uncultured Anaerofustis sp.]